MAKVMEEDGGFRAVVVTREMGVDGLGQPMPIEVNSYYGPWGRAAVAKAEVTKARSSIPSFIDGWIESATWTRVE